MYEHTETVSLVTRQHITQVIRWISSSPSGSSMLNPHFGDVVKGWVKRLEMLVCRGTRKQKYQKKTPDSDVSRLDLFAVQFLLKNI